MNRPLTLTGLIFVASLAGGYLLGSRGGSAISSAPQLVDSASQQPVEDRPAPPLNPLTPFTWARLESTNYLQYIANLRGVRCPEPTITEIIRADLTLSYAPKFAELARSGVLANPPRRGFDQFRRRRELTGEIDSILYDQLHLQRPVRSAGPLFTAEQEQRISDAVAQYPRIHADGSDDAAMAQANSNRLARIEFLSQYLSAEQLEYYKLDREGDAARVEILLEGMQPTKDEFIGVAEAIEGKDASERDGKFTPEVAEALQKVLSPERFEQLQELRQPEYRAITSFARQHQLSPDIVSSLVQLRRKTFSQDPAAYRDQVTALLNSPDLAALYLADRRIHPGTSP